jgi:hypothetical protein
LSPIDQKLRFAHFKLLGVEKIYEAVQSAEILKMLEMVYVDTRFKVARKYRKGGIEKFSKALLGSQKKPKGLKGNFGFLIYIRQGKVEWGYSYIGASTIAIKWFNELCKEFIRPLTDDDIAVVMFPALPGAETHSEYLLLNSLGNFIEKSNSGINKIDGHVVLFTELSPCQSCTSVIETFLRRYQNITAFVAYALEHDYDPKILDSILKTRGAVRQFNAGASPSKMHWKRIA